MEITTISSMQLAKMFLAGAKNLDVKKEWINELNVFPVPDGDTGTNMSMTIMAAAKEVEKLEDADLATVAKTISSGSLRGARGNSGVILSQLFRGFYKVVKEQDELTVDVFCEAMQRACETAYKAVMKPKEGTILTVARGAADKALEMADVTDDFTVFFEEVIKEANATLQKTPDMLPVLKQAGVVDSGGQGLMCILEGGFDCFLGKEPVVEFEQPAAYAFMYHVMFDVLCNNPMTSKTEQEILDWMDDMGENGRVSRKKMRATFHLHTNEPDLVIAKGLEFGGITNVEIINRVDNPLDEATKKANAEKKAAKKEKKAEKAEKSEKKEKKKKAPAKEMGFVTVSIGEGVNAIFKELGADAIIEGGQTMNPSTEDVLTAIESVDAKTVFVLPNNGNIVLAANQAASLIEDKEVIVLPTKTIPQGITALISFEPDRSAKENEKNMMAEVANVRTGQVTYAVRDTEIDGKKIKQGDYMGIGDAGIISVEKDKNDAFVKMIEEMVDENSGIITIYYGADSTEEEANKLAKKLTKKFKDLEIEVQNGGQPVYFYVASVE